MQKLLDLIEIYTELSDHENALLVQAVDKKEFQKNDLIFSEGKISDEIYFVVKGCVRLFYNVDGIDKTAFFYTEGQFICADDFIFEQINAVKIPKKVTVSKISLIEQEIGKGWRLIKEFLLKPKNEH